MHPDVLAVMSHGHGLITRSQALDAGLSVAEIRVLLRRGDWVVVRRGVYADAELWASLDQWRGQPRLRGRAAHLTMRRAHVMSHDSAAHELGLDILAPRRPFVHITRPGVTGAWTEHGVKHHLARFRRDLVVEVEGLEVLDPARTAVDIARERGFVHGAVACDSALHRGVSRAQLWAAVEPMACWPGVRQARAAVEFADEGAESVGESLARQLVAELGIGPIETQFHVRLAEGRVARCDLRVGRHLFEFDGRQKYRRRDAGGLAEADEGAVVWEERTRERLVLRAGFGCSRIIWDDLWGERRRAARAVLRSEYDATVALHGTELTPEQAGFHALLKQRRRTA